MELAPTVRRAFEVRLGAGDRAEWLSLTGHQLEALTALEEGSLTMRCLCERLDISESAGTALSDRLVARGMVAREPDPTDRRVVRLALTDQARSMVQRYRETKRARVAELLAALRREDLEHLVHVYETLANGAAASEDRAEGTPATIASRGRTTARRAAERRSVERRSGRDAPRRSPRSSDPPTDPSTTPPGAAS